LLLVLCGWLFAWPHALAKSPATQNLSEPLTQQPGDIERGRTIVSNRQQGLCVLCHQAPVAEERFHGNMAPDLRGVGARLNAAQLRLRMVDSRLINPESFMPAYFRIDHLNRVATAFQGKTLLSAQDIEDVVAYLLSLKD
jgi:sulfur-oxidizing protein SoxX